MSGHLKKKDLDSLLAGSLDASVEAEFLAHLKAEPDCPACEEVMASLSDEEEQALFVLLAGSEGARDPGDTWQARTLASAGGRGLGWLRWALAGAGLSLMLVLGSLFWVMRLAPSPDDGQRIKGDVADVMPGLRGLRLGRITGEGSEVLPVDPKKPLSRLGQLVFFVDADAVCRLWLVRLGPKDAEALVGYPETPQLRLEAGEHLLRSGDKALGLPLTALRGEQAFFAGCRSADAPPDPARLRAESDELEPGRVRLILQMEKRGSKP
ncbi:MAG: hypothetical protein JRF33_11495 [Deltaproteobacteria bacterium]|nr:hypothetical protein [Deltaproteobacteria bacterium]